MKLFPKALFLNGFPPLLALIGLFVVYYAFELVSIPGVHEFSEWGTILVGLLLFAAGVVWGIYRFKNRRSRANPDT